MEKVEFDLLNVKNDFPLLSRKVNGKPLVYFDNGATTQKPQTVISRINEYYIHANANIHRGVHQMSGDLTIAYENARVDIQRFVNAAKPAEIIFTKGTTDAINLLAYSFGKKYIHEGDEVVISEMEHHSNILPWQQVCFERKAKLIVIPITESGDLVEDWKSYIGPRVKIVAITHVSNTLGTINPIQEIITHAHVLGIPVMIDGAQSIPHLAIDVQALDCDFFCFSGHKVYGPTGVGILYGKEKWLKTLPPYQVGGGTIKTVTFEQTIYAEPPLCFEAGTPHIEGGLGLGAAVEYINTIGIHRIAEYEHLLLASATSALEGMDRVRIIGQSKTKASVLSFVVEGIHPMDIGILLDKQGIAVRTGHHCTQPLMKKYGLEGTVRASFAMYNNLEEVNIFTEALKKSIKMLS